MEIKRLHLYTQHPTAVIDYYRTHLGLEVCEAPPLKGIRVGSTQVFFEQADKVPPYHFAFDISTGMVAEALEAIKAFATPLPDPDTGEEVVQFPAWNAQSIYFYDPAGNVVELIARHNLRLEGRGPFGPAHMHRVSEIGTVVPSVKKGFEALHQVLGLGRYSGNFHNFCAAGEESGLFIISAEGRHWFPTDKPAQPAPYRLICSHLDKEYTAVLDAEGTLSLEHN